MDADQYPRRVLIGSHWSLNCGYPFFEAYRVTEMELQYVRVCVVIGIELIVRRMV